MGDLTRSAPSSGFQKFLLDPKSSVKTYLTENLADKDHSKPGNWQSNGPNIGHQSQGSWQQTSTQQQTGWQQFGNNNNGQGFQGSSPNVQGNQYPPRPSTAAANHPAFQPQKQQAPPVPQLPQQQYGGQSSTTEFPIRPNTQQQSFNSPPITNAAFAPAQHAPTPVHPEHQLPPPFTHEDKPFGGAPAPTFYPPGPSQQAQPPQDQQAQTQIGGPSVAAPVQTTGPPSNTQRIFHRMIVEFESLKAAFYAAKIQPTHTDLAPLASKLKSLAYEIWNLRQTKSNEFQYSASSHELIVNVWKAQLDQWTDILEDLNDPVEVGKMSAIDAEHQYAAYAGVQTTQSYAAAVSTTTVTDDSVQSVAGAVLDPEAALVATPVKKKKVAVKKVVAPAATEEPVPAEGEAAVVKKTVKKKVVKKVEPVEGEPAAAPKKKKVVKKVAE